MPAPQFKLSVHPDTLLSRADCGPTITELLRDCDAVIAPRDISKLRKERGSGVYLSNNLPAAELIALIRSMRDLGGREVYANAQIETGRVSQSNLYNYQTFVDLWKIGSLAASNKFFSHFDFAGISKLEACVITYRDGKTKYVAIYVPPIVEYIPKEHIEVPLEKLRKRAEKEERVVLPGFNGEDGTIILRPLIEEFEAILKNPDIRILPILRDGTHRAYATNLAGTTLHAIIINGSTAMTPSVPRKTPDIILTRGKPEKREDRFLGLDESGWVDLKGVGIDG